MIRKQLLPLLILIALASCSSTTPTPIPPDQIILNAAERMTGTSGFRFAIDRTGAPAYLDAFELLSLSRLEGDYVAPDQVQATVRIVTPGIVTEVSFVGIGESQWQTNPFSGKWETLSPGIGFNPAMLFEPEIGLQAILETDLGELKLIDNAEIETSPGQMLFHLSGKLTGEKTFEITYGLIGPEIMDAELWIAPDTFELHRLILVEHAEDPESTRTWQLDFWDFDLDLEITPPQL
jgi:lipoprotein LprG